ncbi:MAG: undecaprenyl-phosphate glucose phosphotransferase [Parvibaculum sp.]|nr:undecaprenyl-phosphate glucose phosphotransferase [Parvibaculum sp.]
MSVKNGPAVKAPDNEGAEALTANLKFSQMAQPSKRVIADSVMLIDFVVICLCALVAQWIYLINYLGTSLSVETYLTVGVVGAFFAVTAIRGRGIYRVEKLGSFRGQLSPLLFGLGLSFVILLSVAYMLKMSANFSRGWLAIWFSLSALTLFFVHVSVARVLRRWKSFGLFSRRIAIYGSGEVARKLVEHLGTCADEVRIYGVFDDLPVGSTPTVVVAGGMSDMIRVGQDMHFDEVLIALPMSEKNKISNAVMQLSILPTSIRLCPDLVAFNLSFVGVADYDGVSTLEIVRTPMENWAPILKSIEDRVLASIALVLVSPIMILTALAVKLDSPGPVIFRQRRHGFNHQVILVNKFRTMKVAQDGSYVPQAQRGDPRVTRVGKFLRMTSLDELPQLFNVLRGEMSLVGPRPHAIAHNEYYAAILGNYASRHKVKPGITGWAQINGYRGETDTPEKMRKRVEFDLYYIENWSIWLDIKILFLTPFLGLFGRNAF